MWLGATSSGCGGEQGRGEHWKEKGGEIMKERATSHGPSSKNRQIGNVTGYPGVFPGNPHLYLLKPIPIHKGTGFDRCGSWVGYNPQVSKPIWD